MPTSSREQSPLDQWFQRCRDMRTAWWLVAWVALYGLLSAAQLLIWLAAVGSLVMLVMTRGAWRQQSGAGALWLLVLCFLIPGLLSLPGAGRTLGVDGDAVEKTVDTRSELVDLAHQQQEVLLAAP